MPHLAPGSYSISIYATGFTPALEGDIYVEGDKVTRENIKPGISVDKVIEVLANDDGARGMQNDVSNATAK
jgi:protocatechuate 3,4-dioxygenase beta subunit